MDDRVSLPTPFLDYYDLDPGAPGYNSEGLAYCMVPPTEGVSLAVQEAEKGEIFLRADRPWEDPRLRLFVASLLYEDGRYQMWYHNDPRHGRLYYAESTDGVEWEKPDLGLVEYQGSKANNIVLAESTDSPRIFCDPSAPPDERYKMIYFFGPGLTPAGGVSPDGLRWRFFKEPILDEFCDCWNTAYYDEHLGKYVGYFRGWYIGSPRFWEGEADDEKPRPEVERAAITHAPVLDPARRYISRAETDDFRNWPEPSLVLAPDSQDPIQDDFYIPGYVPHPSNSRFHLMFVTVYHRLADTFDTQLAVSRNGIYWTRPERKPIIPLGVIGSREEGMINVIANPGGLVSFGEDRWALAYNRSPWPHKNREQRGLAVHPEPGFVRWAIWQRDRLVALETRQFGQVTLTPRTCQGHQLRLNYRVFPGGWIRVELINKRDASYDQLKNVAEWSPKPLEGYAFQDCEPLCGDELDGVVRWKGGSDLTKLKGRRLIVRFQLARAQLFSFTI